MRTCGLDIATQTGMALVGEEQDRGKVIKLSEHRGFLRLQLIAEDVQRTLRVWKPDLVVVEGYAYCRNIKSFITLVEIGTMVRAKLYEEKLPWVEVPPTVLKRQTTGKGNATKEEMAMAVKIRWNYSSSSHDIIDAFSLAKMGQLGIEGLLKIPGVFLGNSGPFSS